jgi:hypothetical protein
MDAMLYRRGRIYLGRTAGQTTTRVRVRLRSPEDLPLGTNDGERRIAMTTDYGEGIVRRFWEEILGRGDIDAMDEVFATHYRLHDLVYRKMHDLEAVEQIVRETHDAVPGTSVVIDDQWLTVDGRVFTRFTVHVSPPQDAESYQQTAPLGDGWEYNGMTLSRLAEGKIEESWLVWEGLRAAEELGPVFGSGNWRWPPWR